MPDYRDIYIGMDSDVIIRITKTLAFPAAAADGTWTWTIQIDKERVSGGTPDLTHDADSTVLSNGDLSIILTFNIPDTKTDDLLEGENEVDIVSEDGSGKDLPWPEARGIVDVMLPLGTAV
jgi:hypothetical protein